MRVLNALQMKKGAKADSKDYPSTASLTQPVQFLPAKKKDDDWAAWNLDWLELEGMEYLKKTSRKTLKLLGTVGEPINPEAWQWYY